MQFCTTDRAKVSYYKCCTVISKLTSPLQHSRIVKITVYNTKCIQPNWTRQRHGFSRPRRKSSRSSQMAWIQVQTQQSSHRGKASNTCCAHVLSMDRVGLQETYLVVWHALRRSTVAIPRRRSRGIISFRSSGRVQWMRPPPVPRPYPGGGVAPWPWPSMGTWPSSSHHRPIENPSTAGRSEALGRGAGARVRGGGASIGRGPGGGVVGGAA